MKPTLDEEYWSGQFIITRQDLNRAARWLEHLGIPQDLKALALSIIQRRLESGRGSGSAVSADLHGRPLFRFWDPAGDWQLDDGVLFIYDPFGNSKYQIYLGEIAQADEETVDIRIDELQTTKSLLRTLPGTENAQEYGSASEEWRTLVFDLGESKLGSNDLKEQAEGILLKYGEHILSLLVASLRQDLRFTNLESKWYLTQKLPRIDHESLQAIHQFLLQNQPGSLDEILPVIQGHSASDVVLLKMAVQSALQSATDRFENAGTASRPKWKARLPSHDQAHVTHFAFDPQTFEILCRPGQRLSRKIARRLQELDLYAHVVTFTEGQQPRRP